MAITQGSIPQNVPQRGVLVQREDRAGRKLSVIFFIRGRRRTETAQTTALIRIITAWPV